MANIANFKIEKINQHLKNLGLRKTWISLLKTHLNKKSELQYIFNNPEFQDAQTLDIDLLEGLSIGEISALYEFSHATVNPSNRKLNGLYYTPDDIASFIANHTKQFPEGTWLDPCSGIGNLSWHLINAQKDPETFLLEKITLSDKDDLALLIARTILTSEFQQNHNELFKEIEHNFITLDFLSASGKILNKIPKHNFVIANPPYLASRKQCEQYEQYETSRCGDLYAYFLENIIKTSDGFITITPQSFTNGRKFQSLRTMLIEKYNNLTILCFDNMPSGIFSGVKFGSKNTNKSNSTRAAITIALPGPGKHQITSLIRWRSSEREQMLASTNQLTSTIKLQPEFFPKVSRMFQKLYEDIIQLPKLSSLSIKKEGDHILYVPSTPRYFISALKEGVDRSSQTALHFCSEEDLNRAYLLLNSSLMYWWWRVRDGGMTLSREALLTVPVPDFTIEQSLIKMLENSEKINRVYKLNAGAIQENVKHPKELILQLNRLVIPQHADRLMLTHHNSEIIQINCNI